jgi:hypothetical protein
LRQVQARLQIALWVDVREQDVDHVRVVENRQGFAGRGG